MKDKQLRAVIYCRCSTEEESQKSALLQQVRESRESVRRQGWLLVDEYIESASGTTTKKRDEYQRLFEDMNTDKFDIIQIKSQDRLMRNTKDWYLFLDRLVSGGKKLFIYIENKFYSTDDSLITGIKAILAENYSRELSLKINNAHKHRQAQGKVFILPSCTRGYKKLSKYEVVIEESEAEDIRLMFQMVIDGMGSRTCAWMLRQQDRKDRRGKYYDEQGIRRIIRNPLYCGTVIQHKVHYNFETKRYERLPQEQWVVHENAVPAIVSKEVWETANKAMNERIFHKDEGDEEGTHQRGKNIGKFDFSGKIICGLCGCKYHRAYRRRYKYNTILTEWKCSTYLQYGRKEPENTRPQVYKLQTAQGQKGCENIHLDEQRLYILLSDICEEYDAQYQLNHRQLIDKTIHILEKVFDRDKSRQKLERMEQERERLKQLESRLLDKLLQSVISDEDFKIKKLELENKIKKLSDEISAINSQRLAGTAIEQRLKKIKECLEKEVIQKATVLELLERIEKIVVYPEVLEIRFRVDLIDELQKESAVLEVLNEVKEDFKITVPVDERISPQKQKRRALEDIVDMIKENPNMTAKTIAEVQKTSLSAANGRLARLKKAGRIRFNGKGGKGYWEVIE